MTAAPTYTLSKLGKKITEEAFFDYRTRFLLPTLAKHENAILIASENVREERDACGDLMISEELEEARKKMETIWAEWHVFFEHEKIALELDNFQADEEVYSADIARSIANVIAATESDEENRHHAAFVLTSIIQNRLLREMADFLEENDSDLQVESEFEEEVLSDIGWQFTDYLTECVLHDADPFRMIKKCKKSANRKKIRPIMAP